jgi:hypothetical protein
MRRITLICSLFVAIIAFPSTAAASPSVRYGIQDDAWLLYGGGSMEDRVAELDALGVDLVRFTINWNQVESRRGTRVWDGPDSVLRALRAARIDAVVSIWGSPRWANRGRRPHWAPTSGSSFASFASAAAKRYPWVTKWLIWNEPNQRRWLQPTTAKTYVTKLLNPAYTAIHRANRRAKVGGGVTAPRASRGGISPVRFIRDMKAARARFDSYAHHPYPLFKGETPMKGGCDHCETITMATLERLLREVERNFGAKRIWLTEYGYQTNPPDRALGVSRALQARYVAEASLVARLARRVDMLIHYLYRDEPEVGRWQSGLLTAAGAEKPARRAFKLPLVQVSRKGTTAVLWGQVRPGRGKQRYVLQQLQNGRWRSVGGVRTTDSRGFLTRRVRADRGSLFRLRLPEEDLSSPMLVAR